MEKGKEEMYYMAIKPLNNSEDGGKDSKSI